MATRHTLRDTTPTDQRIGLSVDEIGGRVGTAPVTIRRAIWAGELAHFRVGRAVRVRPADLDAWVARLIVGASR
ncbi:MAG: helix-turn-helix domain-containing protein [Deltaproteobacteria bacterium]|nr:helix-turn-helix domain-containing protein [Deltaproteobacteria bacterium]